MAETNTWYYRYLIADTDVGQATEFWGETHIPGDDPACGYTQIPPVPYNHLAGERIFFTGTEWQLIKPEENQP
jgi:hypothetical protein